MGVVQQNKKEVEGCDFRHRHASIVCPSKNTPSTISIRSGTVIVDEAHHICAKVFQPSLYLKCAHATFSVSRLPPSGKTVLPKFCIGLWAQRFSRSSVKIRNRSKSFRSLFDSPNYRNPPPSMRNGKISMPNMITLLVEDRHRNKMLVELVKKASAGYETITCLERPATSLRAAPPVFSDFVGLYMGGMKEKRAPRIVEEEDHLRDVQPGARRVSTSQPSTPSYWRVQSPT